MDLLIDNLFLAMNNIFRSRPINMTRHRYTDKNRTIGGIKSATKTVHKVKADAIALLSKLFVSLSTRLEEVKRR